MGDKYDNQSGIVSAWTLAVIQSMNELPEGGLEILESLGKEIIDNISQTGEVIGETTDDYLEIYDVPEIVFHLSENDKKLQDLNHRVKSLPPEFQKLLHFIIKDYEAGNICETMAYSDQTEYWRKREECLKEFVGSDGKLTEELKSNLNIVFEKYSKIRDNFLFNTDLISKQIKKKRNRKKWIITGLIAVIVPLVFFLLIFPRLIQKDFKELFFYAADKSGYEMTIDSTDLLDEMILEEELYTPESYWLLAMKSLQIGDSEGCRDQLKSLRASDRELFVKRGRYIFRRLKFQ